MGLCVGYLSGGEGKTDGGMKPALIYIYIYITLSTVLQYLYSYMYHIYVYICTHLRKSALCVPPSIISLNCVFMLYILGYV